MPAAGKAVFKLAAEEINDFAQRTPFTRKEILKLHTRFQALSAQGLHSLTAKEVMNIEEMRANPFAPRICELFSEDGSGDLTFEKFLNMMAVFSHRTDPEIKMIWAFAIWDFDGDDVIGPADIRKGLDLMCNGNYNRQGYALDQSSSHLSDEELSNIVNRVSAEIDPYHWGVSYHDFRGVLSRMPDFIRCGGRHVSKAFKIGHIGPKDIHWTPVQVRPPTLLFDSDNAFLSM